METQPTPYRLSSHYTLGERINHPRYGCGKVIAVMPAAIKVQFGNAEILLVQNVEAAQLNPHEQIRNFQ